MNAGAYREKIIIQKKSVVSDDIGQQSEKWSDFFVCHAYVNNISGKEFWEAAQQNAERTVNFIVRYCSILADINTVDYQIIFHGCIYDITFIDNIQYRNQTLKIRAMVRENGRCIISDNSGT